MRLQRARLQLAAKLQGARLQVGGCKARLQDARLQAATLQAAGCALQVRVAGPRPEERNCETVAF